MGHRAREGDVRSHQHPLLPRQGVLEAREYLGTASIRRGARKIIAKMATIARGPRVRCPIKPERPCLRIAELSFLGLGIGAAWLWLLRRAHHQTA